MSRENAPASQSENEHAGINEDVGINPFDPENVAQFQLIATLRLYDVSLALLMEKNPELGSALDELHKSGQIAADFPWFSTGASES